MNNFFHNQNISFFFNKKKMQGLLVRAVHENSFREHMTSSPCFGVIFPGQPMITEFVPLENQRFSCKVAASAQEFMVVLLQTLPAGTGLSIYVLLPQPLPTWQFMGFVSNHKPSELIHMQNVPVCVDTLSQLDLGLAVEPLEFMATQHAPTPVDVFNEFAKKMATNLFNYVESFEKPIPGEPSWTALPKNVLHQWFEKYMNRLSKDPNFWKNL
jgi:hypothetical protein